MKMKIHKYTTRLLARVVLRVKAICFYVKKSKRCLFSINKNLNYYMFI
jgi:hypothetical protein